jgi:hypothetical protein
VAIGPGDDDVLEVTRFRGHPGKGVYGCHGATEASGLHG